MASPVFNHSVATVRLRPEELGALTTLDYNGAPLAEVPYASIHTAGEEEAYKWRLLARLTAEGVRTPVLLARRRGDGPLRLVDGHHRARASFDLGRSLLAEAHECHCPSASLDFLGLCPFLWTRTRELSPS